MIKLYNRRTDKRIGERHFRARLPDADIPLVRELHTEHGLGYKALSKKFDTPVRTIRDICNYQRRSV